VNALTLFFSYAHQDKALQSQLLRHLSRLIQTGQVIPWDDEEILPGVEWKQEIDNHLKTADIIVLLVSPNYMSSAYCSGEEMPVALRRYEAKEVQVLPVILRPTDWRETPLGQLQVLPTNGKSVVEWRDRDQAFQDVAKGIAKVVTSLYEAKVTPPPRFPRPMVNPAPLTPSEVENALQGLPGWKALPCLIPGAEPKKGTELVKTYQFANYDVALGFINRASEHIAAVQHHPTWEITWGTVKTRLTTWDIGHKLSHYDLDVAEYLDTLSREYPTRRDRKE
jgi:pterin-4a-carbinolamine dehydratase